MTADHPSAPAPDPDRVKAIRMDLDPHRPETFAAFGEEPRLALAEAGRAVGAGAVADLSGAARALETVLTAMAAVDPAVLAPRRGLAGLFDSRGARLRRMRQAFLDADRRLISAGEALAGEAAALKAGAERLEPLQAALRAPTTELGAWLEAGRQRLADASAEAGDDGPSARERLSARLEALARARISAVGQLPLIRTLQNVLGSAAAGLEGVGGAVAAWREDWRKALGLEGRRPRRVQPDPGALRALNDRLRGAVARAAGLLEDGHARRARAAERLVELNRSSGGPGE